jgi:hypothetical protein
MAFTVRRAFALLMTSGALVGVALTLAPRADAATIYACVKKSGGAVRIVAKKVKCKKDENRYTWATEGASGKNVGYTGTIRDGLRTGESRMSERTRAFGVQRSRFG